MGIVPEGNNLGATTEWAGFQVTTSTSEYGKMAQQHMLMQGQVPMGADAPSDLMVNK